MAIFNNILRQKKKNAFCSVVVVAAGSSSRMGTDKLTIEIDGMPVIARTLHAMETCEHFHEIVIVTKADNIVQMAHICKDYNITKATKILCGGETRAESALAGLSETSQDAKLVAIHDGARPFVTHDMVRDVINAALIHKAAAPAIPVKDTIKLAEDGFVVSTPDRNMTFAVQTPQVFLPELIKAALTDAYRKGINITDDCSAVEALGVDVFLTAGSEENIKITNPLDICIAEAIIRNRG